MPFNDNLPAEGTNPWYTPLTTAWANLKSFVNGLETSLSSKADTSALTSGLAGKANTSHTHAAADVISGTFADGRIPALAISKTTGLQTALDAKTAGLNGATGLWIGTQAQFDAVTPKVSTVAYIVVG